jgi:hypothetical protein
MTTKPIAGASRREQMIYDHLIEHIQREKETLIAYDALARETKSPAFAFLARIILDDERRHHQMLRDLAETIRVTASSSGEPTPIPELGLFRADRQQIHADAERFIAVEEEDNRDLQRLRDDLRDLRNIPLWEFVVRLMEHDNEKHRLILEFVRDNAREQRYQALRDEASGRVGGVSG